MKNPERTSSKETQKNKNGPCVRVNSPPIAHTCTLNASPLRGSDFPLDTFLPRQVFSTFLGARYVSVGGSFLKIRRLASHQILCQPSLVLIIATMTVLQNLMQQRHVAETSAIELMLQKLLQQRSYCRFFSLQQRSCCGFFF